MFRHLSTSLSVHMVQCSCRKQPTSHTETPGGPPFHGPGGPPFHGGFSLFSSSYYIHFRLTPDLFARFAAASSIKCKLGSVTHVFSKQDILAFREVLDAYQADKSKKE